MNSFLENSIDTLNEHYQRTFNPALGVKKLSWKLDDSWLKESTLYWPRQVPWPPALKWYEQLKKGFISHIKIETKDIPQPSGATLLLELKNGETKTPFIIDIADSTEIKKVDTKTASLYFKMQYKNEGYSHSNVLAGGYLTGSSDVYHYLKNLRSVDQNSFQVYGRFSLEFAKDTRKKALEMLSEQKSFSFEGSPKKIRYSRFLKETARSSLLIDLPGNGPLCFRLIDYLSVGGCVVAPKHEAKLHVPLEHMKNIIYVKPDLSDLISTCENLLKDEKLISEISKNSRDFFDQYLHIDQLTAYYLHHMMVHLS